MPNEINVVFNPKQALAFRYLMDKSTKVIMYGGGAGSGKSWLAAVWLWILMNNHKDLKFAVCRNYLKAASDTFSTTFKKVVNFYGEDPRKYKYSQSYIINTKTGSRITFLNIALLPSDPDFNRLGSVELTGAVIEEAQEVQRAAFDYIATRVGRHLNREYGIPDKILLTCNPGPGWLYTDFYKMRDDPTFNLKRKVVLATVKDNLDYIPEGYVENLQDRPEEIRRRQLEGDWEYTDLQPNTVLPYTLICSAIGVDPVEGEFSIGIDIGGSQSNSDKTVVQVLNGNIIEKPIIIATKSYTGEPHFYDDWLADQIIEVIETYHITDLKRVRVDACGMGAGIYKTLRRKGYAVFPFQGMDRPYKRQFDHTKYSNLRTQSYYELKEKFRKRLLCLPKDYNEQLLEDLAAVRYTDSNGRVALEDKRITHGRLGRSPDFADALCMAAFDLSGQSYQSSYSSSTATATTLLTTTSL